MDSSRLERVLAEGYPGEVTELSMDDLRTRRAECQAIEVGLSYQRRMTQGRLDIVAAERRRRSTGEAPVDHDHLVEQLSGILADRTHGPGSGRLPQFMAPGADDIDTAELDAIAGPGVLGSLPEQDDVRLADLIEELSIYEHRLSAQRRSLHERIDRLQAEITRRYRIGEASVESLLKQ